MSTQNSTQESVIESEAADSGQTEAEMVLPEGYSVMFGEDGQQYVTVVQDDQTYAFPAEEFHQMQQASVMVMVRFSRSLVDTQYIGYFDIVYLL